MPLSITDIIQGCQRNNLRSQEELYKVCYPQMIKVCLRYSSGDMQQAGALMNQGMLKVFQKLSQYRHEGEVMGWIRRVIVTSCIDQTRQFSVMRVESIDSATEDICIHPDAYHLLSCKEILQLVRELPGNTRLVFNLFVFDGYKHDEIGSVLGISQGTSKWHLNEARRILKQKIDLILKKETLSNAI